MDVREFGVQLARDKLLTLSNPADFEKSDCYGRFTFSDSNLWQFFGHGQCVKEAENSAFRSVIGTDPQWTDVQVAVELARRGSKFGPDAKLQITERIPPTQLIADVVGELVEMRDITFAMPERIDGKIVEGSSPFWRISFSVLGKPRVSVVVSA